MMKKISILSLHLGYGGIEKCITSLANTLCDKYEIEIAVSYRLFDESAFHLDERVKVIYLNDSNIVPNREAFKSACRKFNIIKIFFYLNKKKSFFFHFSFFLFLIFFFF